MKMGREIWNDPEARDEYVDTMLWSQDIFREKFYHLKYDELPIHIRAQMERHPRKGAIITEKSVSERVWGPGDTYLVVPEIQVMKIGGFDRGDKVKVTIENIQSSTQTTIKEEN